MFASDYLFTYLFGFLYNCLSTKDFRAFYGHIILKNGYKGLAYCIEMVYFSYMLLTKLFTLY